MGSGYVTDLTGRRGYVRYLYGTHFWQPYRQTDFSRGIVRDMAKTDIPPNGLYACTDYLVHREGHLIKRGSTAYAGPALGTASYSTAVIYAEFHAGNQLLALSDTGDSLGHLYKVTSGTTTDLGGVSTHDFHCVDTPKMFYGPGVELVIFAQDEGSGGSVPIYYDGTNAPARLEGGVDGKYIAIYKGRVVIGGGYNTGAGENRIYFSPTLDPRSTWDQTNAWIDADHPVTGLCALQNCLLIFSLGHTERLTGATPPPNSDMDRQPVGDIGCIDARSIAIYQNSAIFANARGVYMTNGVGFRSITAGPHGNDGIESYWQKTVMAGFTAGTDTLAGGIIRDFYIVSCSKTGITLMCHIPTGAWTQLSNINATMFASAATSNDELYYSDGGVARVVTLSGIFQDENDITGSGKDANGTAIAPSFETKAFGTGMSDVAWGDSHVLVGMNDTSPASSPTLAVQYVPFVYSSEGSAVTCSESPLAATAHGTFLVERKRFSTGVDAPAMSLKVAQTGASSATVVRAVEIDQRGYPNPIEGPNG